MNWVRAIQSSVGACSTARAGFVTCVPLWSVAKMITWVGGRDCVLPLPGQNRVILLPVIVGVKELFEPLNELKVVLELPFDQLLHGNDLDQETEGHG